MADGRLPLQRADRHVYRRLVASVLHPYPTAQDEDIQRTSLLSIATINRTVES